MKFSRHARPGRPKLAKVVNSQLFHIAVLCLILFDLTLVLTSLILEVFYPSYEYVVVTCDSAEPSSEGSSTDHGRRLFEDGLARRPPWIGVGTYRLEQKLFPPSSVNPPLFQQTYENFIESSLEPSGNRMLSETLPPLESFPPAPPGCEFTEKIGRPHSVETALTVLEWISVGVLSIMVIEVFLNAYALGRNWFTILHVFDAAVVVASLVLEVVLRTQSDLREALAVLIVARLWRVVRIFQSFEEAFALKHEKEQEELKKKHEGEVEQLKRELAELKGDALGLDKQGKNGPSVDTLPSEDKPVDTSKF